MKYGWFVVIATVLLAVACDEQSERNKEKTDKRPNHVPDGFDKIHPEGLYIKYRFKGEGDELDTGDVAIFHYLGKRADLDRTFENTYETGRPKHGEIGQEQLMPALNYVLAQSQIGDEFTLHVPPQLGFGNRIVKKVPVGKPLILSVQVLGKKKPKAPFDTTGIAPEKILLDMDKFVIEPGEGARPKEGQVVELDYNGYYLDSGKKFGSSYDDGLPILFEILSGEVIQGLDAAARSMQKGEKARVIIPWEYGYGEKGRNQIPGNKDLVYDIHLKDIREGE